jgi:hypothetical protein
MNRVLFDFASKCSKKSKIQFTWPVINLADRTFHPIQHAHEILTQKKGQLEKSLLFHKFDPGHERWETNPITNHPITEQVTEHLLNFPEPLIAWSNSL